MGIQCHRRVLPLEQHLHSRYAFRAPISYALGSSHRLDSSSRPRGREAAEHAHELRRVHDRVLRGCHRDLLCLHPAPHAERAVAPRPVLRCHHGYR